MHELPKVMSGTVESFEATAGAGAWEQAYHAGPHLIVDLYGGRRLDDQEFIEQTLLEGAQLAGATVLNSYFHCFSQNGGVTGIVALAESHISIHSWPEHSYAAIDIFMCGAADPRRAVEVIKKRFEPARLEVTELSRGRDIQPQL